MSRDVVFGGLVAGILAAATGFPAQAQTPVPQGPGTDAQPTAYDPLGVPVGSFRLFPRIGLAETYDDNIYAVGSDRTDDFITVIAPTARLQSDWTRHSLTFTAGAEAGRNARHTAEDYEDYALGLSGRVDVQRDTQLTGGLNWVHEHEDRSSPDATAGQNPTEYNRTTLSLGGSHKFNRLALRLSGNVNDHNFDDQTTPTATINNDDRDRREYDGSLRVGYEMYTGYQAFVQGGLNRRNYDSAVDDGGVNRDSRGHTADVGVEFDITRLMKGEVYAGVFSQNYSDATLRDPSGMRFGGDVEWSATALTTVKLDAGRSVDETTTGGTSSIVSTTFGARVDHELRRNIKLNARARYTMGDYRGIGRDDDSYDAGGGVEYLLNRNFSVEGDYRYTTRDATGADSDFVRNQMMLRINAYL